jgi:hypothetical protein
MLNLKSLNQRENMKKYLKILKAETGLNNIKKIR